MAAFHRDDHFFPSVDPTNETRTRARLSGFVGALFLVPFFVYAQSSAQSAGFGICRPVSERTGEVGCWIMTDVPVGRLDQPQVFWYLDVYPTRAAAEKAKEGGTVLESLGKVWLLTIGQPGWRPSQEGERIAEIGPIPVIAGREYSALYMEAILDPGMTSAIHTHSGPEAWLTVAGETCLETPEGKIVGRPGGRAVIVPAGMPMLLTATGAEQRRALTLILHESSERPTTVVHDWTPKGLCKK
jgi:quercetin dioxygenase-like cupin family protein